VPSRVIRVHADTATALDAQGASAPELATRSFKVPGVRQVLLVRVTGVQGSRVLAADSHVHATRIVTDYRMTVLRSWARGTAPSSPTLLRIPGGTVDGTMEIADDAPTVQVGNQYLVWDQTQPPGAAAGPSQPGTAVVPSRGNIANLSPDGVVNWAGKTASIHAMETALAEGAGR